ncbi:MULTISPECIES: hypothetical protein [unclassified Luteimonas]|uniref:GNAT family N-acetyltransferase n=1 Tax=unclassified Luteimonas TaxID=2629088 RepID=UPI001600F483|nr:MULTISPECIES: hypothetical protein [unclassified Luteimonas]MBB1472854.1 hypothetical protein [Luteimonas sp. MC1782]MBB6598442.1 hypothetical protein [Luteimonas sp. MC1825]QOC88638.1 hypothetical protein IDM46_02445 [Luteimonas sp. MC1825]
MLEHAGLARSAPDSARFGLDVWRATRLDGDPLPALLASAADVAIYRLPVGASQQVRALAGLGFEVIDAGVLVYYTVDLQRRVPHAPANADVDISPATPADDDALAALVDASFGGYASHYFANPLFAPELALAGYREWALAHRGGARTASWVARRAGRIVAFACCEADAAAGIANGGIYGVLPSEAGSGLFGDLIRHTQRHYRALGFAEMRMSTKVDNFAVQKVWAREGYHLYAAYDTLHVNAMLGAPGVPTVSRGYAAGALRDQADGWPLPVGDIATLLADACGAPVQLDSLAQLPLAVPDARRAHRLELRQGWAASGGRRRANAWLRDDAGRACALVQAGFRT